ncbi:ABC transporter permease [Streptomyces sp. NWU339]|uniref:ABC transporter permease n=1 Tax=Streptomyces sp. NWU339 TaxID=2185284 RepID=UPI0015E7F076|nr:ABC transporter permease [Streptomyces sp. NWU339]
MGLRFALAGGREGWVRALLTGVGVGLGVALLLLTAAIPGALEERHRREEARLDWPFNSQMAESGADNTLLVARVDTQFRDREIRGRVLEPEGPKAPLPPGLKEFPAAGDMVVSPALKEFLASDDARLLRERLPYDIVGTIGEQGLIGSQELAYYAGGTDLADRINSGTVRLTALGSPEPTHEELDPVLMLLVLVVFVALLTPVAVFIATAVRFGGERRDRRLAALRLVGSDAAATRRIAAGEALAGSLLGLALGTVFFLIGREVAASVEIFRISVFPSYLNPSPLLALLVAVAVPAAAVLVTLLALRGVVIEPLGVVRTARPARRRLWWRLLLPLAGIMLLSPMIGQGRDGGEFNQYLVISGVLLLLVGVTALLPWLVETVVARLGKGSVSWQLAVRRLQLSSGTAARMVNGIAVAVAGAIALQMLFAGVEDDYTKATGYDVSRAQIQIAVPRGVELASVAQKVQDTEGVQHVHALSKGHFGDLPWRQEPERFASLTVGDCATLREVAKLPSCRDGDVFALSGAEHDTDTPSLNTPGQKLYLEVPDPTNPSEYGEDVLWTVPKGVKQARSIPDPTTYRRGGFLMTPGAVPAGLASAVSGDLYIALDDSVPYAHEYVRNTAAAIDPLSEPMAWQESERSNRYESIRTGLFVGAVCVLVLIGASLLVSQLEQLRERRKLLSALVAFGTRRRTLSLSVLWQTAVPIGLGLALAATVGVALGAVLLRMAGTSVRVDWASLFQMTGIGAGVVLAVTLLSLPPLLRMMRPDGLRTE